MRYINPIDHLMEITRASRAIVEPMCWDVDQLCDADSSLPAATTR